MYEKAIYSHQGDVESLNRILIKKANCYQEIGDHNSALATINRANFYKGSDSTKFNLYYKAALYSYLTKEFKAAQGYLLEMQYYITNNNLVQNCLFLEILIHYSLEEWEESLQKFKKYSQINGIDSLTEFKLTSMPFPKMKNTDKAENLSAFLPGIGQWYAGYPLKGITSGALQLTFAGWGAYSIYNGYFFSGAFTGISIFYLFYSGGTRYASFLANQTNIKRNENYIKPFKELILNNEYNKKGGL